METGGEGSELATLLYDGEEFEVPVELLQDKNMFKKVLSLETWHEVLTSEDRQFLQGLLPAGASPVFKDEVIGLLFSGQEFKFGNPVEQVWNKLNEGSYSPETFESKEQLKDLKYQQYQLDQKRYHLLVLQELLLARQEMLQTALATGSLDNLPKRTKQIGKRRLKNTLQKKAEVKFRRILAQCRRECGCDGTMSSDDDAPSSDDEDDTNVDTGLPVVTEGDYRRMLKAHYRLKLGKKNSSEAVTTVAAKQTKPAPVADDEDTPVPSRQNSPALVMDSSPRPNDPEVASIDEAPCLPRSKACPPSLELQQVYKVYSAVDTEMKKEVPVTPITIMGPLPSDKYLSFFGVLKSAFEAQPDKKGELSKIAKSVGAILKAECGSCAWVKAKKDWVDLTMSALLYLSAEVGAVCTFDALPHFIPLIEFRDRIDHWKWTGQERDSELELLVLCNHWLENLGRALHIVDFSDYDPPTPRVWTHAVFKQTTTSEVQRFREQEVERYLQPHKAYTFNIHGYEASVGPVKGARAPSSKKEGGGSRARGHALLVAERPNCVTILSLVRDATSRLPNGEGTRIDLCILVRDSQYLQETVSDTQLNNAVSGALDRLHYEKDPCVRYDNARKLWIYLHRGRSEEEFELIHWASEVAAKQRKYFMMSRPKIKPKIIIKSPDGQTTEVSPGSGSGSVATPLTPLTPLCLTPTLTPTLPPILTPTPVASAAGSGMGPGTAPVLAKPSPKSQPRRQTTNPQAQATPSTQAGAKTTPVAVVSSGGKQVVVASIMPGKAAGSQQQQQQQQQPLNTLALVQQALAKQHSQLSLQLGGGGGGHEGKGATQLSLDAAQLLSQLMAARGGGGGLSGLGSLATSIAGMAKAGGVNVGAKAGGESAKSGVSTTGGGGVSAGVAPHHDWLTESEEEGLPVGADGDDDWDGSESD